MRSGKCFLMWAFVVFTAFTLLCAPGLIPSYQGSLAYADIPETFDSGESAPVVVYDPHEKFNRSMFTLNDKIFIYVIKPVGTVYAAYFPPGFRSAVRSGFYNILFPVRFINCLLQGKGEKAGTETARFVINSTIGVGGLFDPAQKEFNLAPQDEDFGQTLAVWGAGSGAYLVIPVLGPMNWRDLGGFAVDSAMDPIFWIPAPLWVSPTVRTGKLFNNASLRIREYEDFKKAALDPYVSLRSAYQQHRLKEISK